MNLKTLAEHLGLSQATVSRGLNGFPEVNSRTRERIEKAARELGYRPNPNAQKLATGKANSVGFIFPVSENIFLDLHFTEFLVGITSCLAEHGFDLTFSAATPGEEMSTYRRFIQTRQADVIIVSGPRVKDERVELLLESTMPFVIHGRSELADRCHYYDVDNRGGFHLATQHLVDLGHSRIACINGRAEANFAADRLQGYRETLTNCGLKPDPDLISHSDMTREEGYRQTLRCLDLPSPPTGLVCASTFQAIGVLAALKERSLEPGRDIALVAYDDVLPVMPSHGVGLPLTVVRSPIREGGRGVAQIAAKLVRDAELALQQVIAPVELELGQTSCPAPGREAISAVGIV